MAKETTVKEYLKYTFSDAETLEISKSLAKANQDLSEIEAEKKRITADFSAKIQREQAEIDSMARKVYSGYEFRNIECAVDYHTPAQGKKTITRLDTGEVVRTDVMSHSELQEQLEFAEAPLDSDPPAPDGKSAAAHD